MSSDVVELPDCPFCKMTPRSDRVLNNGVSSYRFICECAERLLHRETRVAAEEDWMARVDDISEGMKRPPPTPLPMPPSNTLHQEGQGGMVIASLVFGLICAGCSVPILLALRKAWEHRSIIVETVQPVYLVVFVCTFVVMSLHMYRHLK